MVLAIAALLFHLAPTADTRAFADVSTSITNAEANTTNASGPLSGAPPQPAANALPDSPKPTTFTASASPQNFSNIRVPEPQPAKPLRLIPVENTPARRNWLILSVIQHGAATFDAYSTRQAIASGAREDDPLMRPFAHSPAIYFASQVSPLALDYLGRHMQRSQNLLLRRTWWLPQSASTGLFMLSGSHNLRASPQH